MKKKVSLLLLLPLLCSSLYGCDVTGFTSKTPKEVPSADTKGLIEFSASLLSSCANEENTLVSPLSVLYALSMTANGAKAESLSQMEAVMGMSVNELNLFLSQYRDSIPSSKGLDLQLANALWLADDKRLTLDPDFQALMDQYYHAELHQDPFNEKTKTKINRWVNKQTDGMIKDILDQINPSAVLYLINALSFKAKWSSPYRSSDVTPITFTQEDGTESSVEMMYSKEGLYLSDENTTGFIKNYVDDRYAFVALLPKEGLSMKDYLTTLSGEKIQALLSSASFEDVSAGIPKFTLEYSTDLSMALSAMGMPDVFDDTKADLSGIGKTSQGSLVIDHILHKTFIEVQEEGTRAAAVTAVSIKCNSAAPVDDPKTVILDRPFVYMIYDTEVELPLFIGTAMTIE